MRISAVNRLEKDLEPKLTRKRGRPRGRALFGPIPCDNRLVLLLKKKKNKKSLTWEEVLTRAGIGWLKNGD